MTAAEISIAMATYNGAKFLPIQLASLSAQKAAPRELIVCDDGSKDTTLEILARFQASSPFPVTIVSNSENLGPSDNFLKAASLCTGSIVAFCDQDDIWHPDKLAEIENAFSDNQTVLVAHQASVFYPDGRRHDLVPLRDLGTFAGSEMFPWRFYYGFSCSVRRTLIDLYPYDKRPKDLIAPERLLGHDRWIAFLASIVGRTTVLPHRLTDYRQHGSNDSGWMRAGRGLAPSIRAARYGVGYHLGKYADIADDLARISREISTDENSQIHDLWLAYAASLRARLDIFCEDSRPRRWKSLRAAVQNGCYSRTIYRQWILEIARDLTLTVLAARRQKRLGEMYLGSKN